jgi:hypothetical protein
VAASEGDGNSGAAGDPDDAAHAVILPDPLCQSYCVAELGVNAGKSCKQHIRQGQGSEQLQISQSCAGSALLDVANQSAAPTNGKCSFYCERVGKVKSIQLVPCLAELQETIQTPGSKASALCLTQHAPFQVAPACILQ